MESQVAKLSRLDSKVLECLCLFVNDLVNEFSFNLISGHSVPPEELVEVVGHWFQQALGNIDMTAMFDDFLVYEFGDLGSGVVLWTVQFIGLRSGIVVLEHDLQGPTDINGLEILISWKESEN